MFKVFGCSIDRKPHGIAKGMLEYLCQIVINSSNNSTSQSKPYCDLSGSSFARNENTPD